MTSPELGCSFASASRVAANIDALLAFVSRNGLADLPTGAMSTGSTRAEVRTLGLNVLQTTQQPVAPQPLVRQLGTHSVDTKLLRELLAGEEPTRPYVSSPAEVASAREAIVQSLDELRRRLPGTAEAVQDLIVQFVITRPLDRRHGASVSSVIGTIWLAPSPSWTPDTYVEAIVHEFVHNALFLEEAVHTLFTDEVLNTSTHAGSAILGTRRQYDRAFHSAFVLLAVGRVAEAMGFDSPTLRHLTGLRSTVDGLAQGRDCLTPHGLDLLDELAASVA